MRTLLWCVAAAVLGIASLSNVDADEQDIPLEKLPKAVTDAVHKMFPKAKLLRATQEAHVRRKVQSAVVSGLVEGLPNILHGFDFDKVSGLQVKACDRCRSVVPSPIRTKKYPANSPEEPCPDAICHLEQRAIASPNFADAFPEPFPP